MDGADLRSEFLLSGNSPQAKVQEPAKEEYDYEYDYGNGKVPNLFPEPETSDPYVFPAFPDIVDDPSVNRPETLVPQETDDNPMPPLGIIQNEEESYGDIEENNFF